MRGVGWQYHLSDDHRFALSLPTVDWMFVRFFRLCAANGGPGLLLRLRPIVALNKTIAGYIGIARRAVLASSRDGLHRVR